MTEGGSFSQWHDEGIASADYVSLAKTERGVLGVAISLAKCQT
jgi:hypothetical protein